MKKLKVVLILISAIVLFFVARKFYAVSDTSLLKYHWKAYNSNCEVDFVVVNKKDLDKISDEWELTYRWIDNTVFLRINDCIYISK